MRPVAMMCSISVAVASPLWAARNQAGHPLGHRWARACIQSQWCVVLSGWAHVRASRSRWKASMVWAVTRIGCRTTDGAPVVWPDLGGSPRARARFHCAKTWRLPGGFVARTSRSQAFTAAAGVCGTGARSIAHQPPMCSSFRAVKDIDAAAPESALHQPYPAGRPRAASAPASRITTRNASISARFRRSGS